MQPPRIESFGGIGSTSSEDLQKLKRFLGPRPRPSWPFKEGQLVCSVCCSLGLIEGMQQMDQNRLIRDLKDDCGSCTILSAILALYADLKTREVTSFRLSQRVSCVSLQLINGSTLQDSIDLFTGTKEPSRSHDTRTILRTSTDIAASASTWIQQHLIECMESSDHRICPSMTFPYLPSRVLDITDSNHIKLREFEHGERAHYVCLSHCWGVTQPLRTTRATLEAHKHNIPWEWLPKTFQQAIIVVQKLQLQFLWIDSLCIIQDDLEDWRNEGSKMADIYAHSYLTISAMSAQDSSGGLFSNSISACRCHTMTFGDSEHVIFTQRRRERTYFNGFNEPLLKRGWAFQETILAPRVAHFTSEGLFWECISLSECEVPELGPNHSVTDKARLIDPSSPDWESWEKAWRRLVVSYTTRDLTYEQDIFPALQGLAYLTEEARKSRYFAGLWEDTLVKDLSWIKISEGQARRPSKWRAPSWSWASVMGPVRWPVDIAGHEISAQATAFTEPAGTDHLGQLKSGELRLNAPYVEVTLDSLCYRSWPVIIVGKMHGPLTALAGFVRRHDLLRLIYHPDYDLDSAWQKGDIDRTVDLALMTASPEQEHEPTGTMNCLALRSVERCEQLYERIGFVTLEFTKNHPRPFHDASMKTWHII